MVGCDIKTVETSKPLSFKLLDKTKEINPSPRPKQLNTAALLFIYYFFILG